MSFSHTSIKIIDPKHESHWASKISNILTESSEMFMESNGGHVPDEIVRNIVHEKYTSLDSITNTFYETAHRFILTDNINNELIGTLLIGISYDTILVKDSRNINVSASKHTGFSPLNYHHAFNFAININYRNKKYGKYFISNIMRKYRNHFDGKGIWIHAEPPWHEVFQKLGFEHATEFDQFFYEEVELPKSVKTVYDFNKQFICDCEKGEIYLENLLKYKYKYHVFTMDFIGS